MEFRGCHTGGFEFDTAGGMQGTPQMSDFYRHCRDQITHLSALIDDEVPIACGCLHEQRIAKTYGTRDAMAAESQFNYYGPSPKTIAALCKDRDCNALCAHRTDDFSADPLGFVLERFDRLRLLERVSWTGWHAMMSKKIQTIDREVRSERFSGAKEAEDAVALAREKQQELIKDIEGIKNILRNCIATALEWIDRYNNEN